MAEGRNVGQAGEAIVLRTWPFHEADLLISLFTRDEGKVKGVARHAMRSRKRFGGALEPATHVRACYTERPRQDLVRMDAFEILWSPLTERTDWPRAAGLQLVVEVLEEALPDRAPDDHLFRLSLAVLAAMEAGQVWLPVTYFCVWMCRLMGWLPELGHCCVCGLDMAGKPVWWSPAADGVTCSDDRRKDSRCLSADNVAMSAAMLRNSLGRMSAEGLWQGERAGDLSAFAIGLLERHLERRLKSARMLESAAL